LRKTEPKIVPPVAVTPNTPRKREPEKEREQKQAKKQGSWLDGLKKFGKGLLGDDLAKTISISQIDF
jgi:hypothetical protein